MVSWWWYVLVRFVFECRNGVLMLDTGISVFIGRNVRGSLLLCTIGAGMGDYVANYICQGQLMGHVASPVRFLHC